ncbi:MAG: type II toxin-antitoxin system HicB family antitoxin [Chloroflexi bacterium]|nr:type II toxin-antitoxin system HicB family antitoxin [Chloroflexota bacterium]
MKQLITRVDEELHGRLKARAAAEGMSLNALVTGLLHAGLADGDHRARVRARMQAAGLSVVHRPSRRPPSQNSAIRSTRGAGSAASEALEAERSKR